MTPKYFIGVDISKLTLDFALLSPSGQISSYKIENSEKGILEMLSTLKKDLGFRNREVVILAEDMRVMAQNLLRVSIKNRYPVYLESALHIKKSLGIQRGKNDKLDAIRIAQFAKRNYQDLKLWQPPRECIEKLRQLCTIRKRLVKIRIMLVNGEASQSAYMTKSQKSEMGRHYSSTLTAVEQDLVTLEAEMLSLVQQDERLSRLLILLTSIPYVGNILAIQLVVHTNEFYDFTDPKKFASYCGVAPFEYSSGTSVSGRTKVSHFANKEMKSMLHFAAIGYISKPGYYFLSRYYQRKVEEGKNKMSVINVLRNKLIARIFACVNNNKKFVEI